MLSLFRIGERGAVSCQRRRRRALVGDLRRLAEPPRQQRAPLARQDVPSRLRGRRPPRPLPAPRRRRRRRPPPPPDCAAAAPAVVARHVVVVVVVVVIVVVGSRRAARALAAGARALRGPRAARERHAGRRRRPLALLASSTSEANHQTQTCRGALRDTFTGLVPTNRFSHVDLCARA